jgi:hypothetical protein
VDAALTELANELVEHPVEKSARALRPNQRDCGQIWRKSACFNSN